MYARVKPGCGIEEAKKDIKQLTEKVEKLGKVGEKLEAAVRKLKDAAENGAKEGIDNGKWY